MTFDELCDFIEHKMSMSHVYQPVLIRALVDAGGSATLRQLAQVFLIQDESELLYYERRIKEMPVPVLSRHNVLERNGNFVSLTVPPLDLEQRAHIRMLCEDRLQKYVKKRGLTIWDYRLLETDPVPDSIRYRVLAASGGRCALCGATKDERPIDVDHIKPRSKGGTNDESNLQALCSKCNRSKRDQDDTDFRTMPLERLDRCLFCSADFRAKAVDDLDTVFAVEDAFPVSPGHHLIVPRRHTDDFFSMTEKERHDANSLLRLLRNKIETRDPRVTGFNVGANAGVSAGQTVMHAHIHLIPRRDGDTPAPRGGIRGVIPGKMAY